MPTQPGQKILVGLHRSYGVRHFETHWPGALRRRLLTTEKAIQIANLAESILAENEFTVSTSAVLQLVSRSRCSAYDCEFVALAEEQRVPLVTLDRQILHDFPDIAVSLQEFIRE
jgi:predicted nucleic acid-binding protein